MTTLGDVLNNRNIPTYHPAEGAPQAAGFADDIGQITAGMARDSLQAQRAQLAAAELRAAQLKFEADAEEAQERLDASREERAQRRRPQHNNGDGGGGNGEMINALITLVTETQKDTRNLMTQLTEKQNEELKATLDATREQLTAAISRPPEDPVASIQKYVAVFQALQGLAPHSEPTNAAAQNVRDVIELEQARNKMEMDRLAFRADHETNENEKRRIEGEIASRQVRDWQMAKALQETIPQLTAALTARITGTPWNPEPPPPPPAPRAWVCFNCHAENQDPPDTIATKCKSCGIDIRLVPDGMAPPPLAPPEDPPLELAPPEAPPALAAPAERPSRRYA